MPSYDSVLKEIYEVLQPFAKEGQSLSEETELVTDLGLDSVQVMELLLQIEDRFDVSIPLNIMPDVRTIKDLVVQLIAIIDRPQ
ncbi:MAG TPA: acyl carrier protein [Candidatus Competibacteraceae bacterium]|nr:acyl carrier protein [Candidatus Competibacteraceae bacterium]